MNSEKARNLLEEFHTPAHIIKHCEKVAFVSQKIALFLNRKWKRMDVDLVFNAALLHDLFRVIDIDGAAYEDLCKQYSKEDKEVWDKQKLEYKGLNHSEAAAEYFYQVGETLLSEVIRKHRFDAIIDPKEQPFTLEEKILTYADKRVLYTNIVTLKERLDDGHKRYNPDNENLDREMKIHEAYFQLDKEFSASLV